MGQNFRVASLDQPFLLPQDVREWLPKDHFAYFVLELVKQLDASGVLGGYGLDGRGAAAYHPIAMLALLVYAYCDGERSSRRIEARCRTDVGFRLMTGGLVPDHTTIARFRDRHEPVLTRLFVAVLVVCLKAGMGDVRLVAIDGSKFACSASLRANRTLAQIEAELAEVTEQIEAELSRIAAQMLESGRRADLEEEDLFGAKRARGELPTVVGLKAQAPWSTLGTIVAGHHSTPPQPPRAPLPIGLLCQ